MRIKGTRPKRKNFGLSLPLDELDLLDRLAADQKRNRSQMIAWLVWEYAKAQGAIPSHAPRQQQPEPLSHPS